MNTLEVSNGALIALVAGIRLRAKDLADSIRTCRGLGNDEGVAYWNGRGRDLLEAAESLGFSHVIREEIGETPESWKPEVPA
jgi:hypothetical protein